MKDNELKNIWNMINDDTLGFDALNMTKDQIISSRSGSVQNKLRAMLQNDLILIIMLQTVGIITVPAVGRPPGRLNISNIPGFGTQRL